MKAARWHGRRDVRVERIPDPEPGPGEVLVQVALCGICGTDVEEHQHGALAIPVGDPHPLTGRTAPLTLGHEVVGTVAGHGPATDASTLPVGTRVVPDVVLGCGTCWWCRRHQEGLCERHAVRGLHLDGGLAEFMVADADTCVIVPDDMAWEVAVLAEPVAVAVRALRKVDDLTGATVLVLGSGTIGLLITQIARASGARTVAVDVQDGRIDLAAKAGAIAMPPPDMTAALGDLTGGRGADVVFECTGQPDQLGVAVTHCRRGGQIVAVGFSATQPAIPLIDFVLGEKRLIGTAAHLWDEDVTSAVHLLAAGIVNQTLLRLRVAGLEQVPGLLANPDPQVLKVAIRP